MKHKDLNIRNTQIFFIQNTAIILLVYDREQYKKLDYLYNDLDFCRSKSNIKKIHIYIDIRQSDRCDDRLKGFLARLFSGCQAQLNTTKFRLSDEFRFDPDHIRNIKSRKKITIHYQPLQLYYNCKQYMDEFDNMINSLCKLYPDVKANKSILDKYAGSGYNDYLYITYNTGPKDRKFDLYYTNGDAEEMYLKQDFHLCRFNPYEIKTIEFKR